MEFVRAEKKDVRALIESRVVYLRAAIGEMSEAEEAETRQKLLPFFHDHLERDLFVRVIPKRALWRRPFSWFMKSLFVLTMVRDVTVWFIMW